MGNVVACAAVNRGARAVMESDAMAKTERVVTMHVVASRSTCGIARVGQ